MSNLPPRATSKLGSLADAANDAQAIVNSTLDRIRELEFGINSNPTGPNAADWKTELRRITARRTAHQSRFAALAATVASCRSWLQSLPASIVFELIEPPVVKLNDGETIEAAVDRIRGVIATTQRELSKVKDAALPIAELKAQAKAHVDELVRIGRPRIICSDKDAFSFRFETRGFSMKSPINEVIAWLAPDLLLKRLCDEIDAMPEMLRLSAIEKAGLIVTLSSVLDDAERQEENLIEHAADRGQTIPRRHNASPAAILGVRVVKRKAVAA